LLDDRIVETCQALVLNTRAQVINHQETQWLS